jgi:hypothetical protein
VVVPLQVAVTLLAAAGAHAAFALLDAARLAIAMKPKSAGQRQCATTTCR